MDTNEMTDKAIDYSLDGLASERRLTEWEKNFVESITDQWTSRHSLSDKQKEVLGKIWDRY
jgi:hypothetical protein